MDNTIDNNTDATLDNNEESNHPTDGTTDSSVREPLDFGQDEDVEVAVPEDLAPFEDPFED